MEEDSGLREIGLEPGLRQRVDETREIINAKTLAQLPKGSYVVNTSRGGTVNPLDVVAALASGHLAGAGLDVTARSFWFPSFP